MKQLKRQKRSLSVPGNTQEQAPRAPSFIDWDNSIIGVVPTSLDELLLNVKHIQQSRELPSSYDETTIFLMDKLLDAACVSYYVEHTPSMTDSDFDRLLKDRDQLAKKLHMPSYGFGSDLTSGFIQRKHYSPVLSIQDAFGVDEVHEQLSRLDSIAEVVKNTDTNSEAIDIPVYVIEDKIDGVAIVIVYEDGRLQHVLTRGNGSVGDDVTDNLLAWGLRRTISIPGIIEIRAEVCIDESTFTRLNDERIHSGNAPYKNPRNLASGTLKLHDPVEFARRKPSVVVYDTYPSINSSEIIRELGLETVRQRYVGMFSDVMAWLLSNQDKPTDSKYPIDGYVIKVTNHAMRRKLGHTSSVVKWAIAYKFQEEIAETKVIDIAVNPGRTGVLVPVAIIEPVELAGTTVRRATCHSVKEFVERKVHIGATIKIKKSGEIIPYIISSNGTVKKARAWKHKLKCPVCGGKATYDTGGDVHAYCLNPKCSGRLVSACIYAYGRDALYIKGMGVSTISTLIGAKLLTGIWDILKLTVKDITSTGIGKRVATKLVRNIKAIDKLSPHLYLTAMGLPNLGPSVAKTIMLKYGTLDNLLKTVSVDGLRALEGIDSNAELFANEYFKNPDIIKTIKSLPKWMTSKAMAEDEDKPTLVITGKLNMPKAEYAETHYPEYKLTNSVNKNTALVVVAKGSENSTKAKKAKALGLPIRMEIQQN